MVQGDDNARAADLARTLAARLLAARNSHGWWAGELASSALATAVATFALAMADRSRHAALVSGGLAWLGAHQNPDGGWGDTPDSPTNLSTTLLAWSALARAESSPAPAAVARAEGWLSRHVGGCEPAGLAEAVLAHYGNDRTFSAPILMLCALAGRLGPAPGCWRLVPQLPFELARVPRRFFSLIGLPVVSYALPALIAIGLARHRQLMSRNPLSRGVRKVSEAPVLQLLQRLQPDNGGFLEASPLTGFVLLSLVAAGQGGNPVAAKCADFLANAVRPDGSWPIDTHLATWVTTLAIKALAVGAPAALGELPAAARDSLTAWLRGQQLRREHLYTGAAPGGWSWTPLPGGVPDADDTAGALLALYDLGPRQDGAVDPALIAAAEGGLGWLCGLQNRDGGIPTFCRGWGRLPFDRSCAEITAHALQAFAVWMPLVAPGVRARAETGGAAMLAFLRQAQRPDGAWEPLWFGNQAVPGHGNPVYGTARVVAALACLPASWQTAVQSMVPAAVAYLIAAQGPDGGWGGAPGVASTIEETGLALGALAAHTERAGVDVIRRGVAWLEPRCATGVDLRPAPIGLYFASLWYSEKLYPLLFALTGVSAAALARFAMPAPAGAPPVPVP